MVAVVDNGHRSVAFAHEGADPLPELTAQGIIEALDDEANLPLCTGSIPAILTGVSSLLKSLNSWMYLSE
jgi:hypothetical protein